MANYPTRMFDGQIWFGSGSKVNADDIPETLTKLWLTNSLQAISGSKIFSDALNMNFNNIINVTDPTSNQDAVTKHYTDIHNNAISGSTVQGTSYTSNTLGNISSGNSVTVTHNLSSDYLLIELMYTPTSGDHTDKWINAEGVLYYKIQNSNSLTVFNTGSSQVNDGDALISIIGLN